MSANSTSNFQGYESCSRPTSRVLRPPGGGSSNIFGAPEPSVQVQAKPKVEEVVQIKPVEVEKPVPAAKVRRDPITGEIIGGTKKEVSDEKDKENEVKTSEDPMKQYEPHLGPQKNFTGLKCAQPPGGKSNIFFG